MLRVLDLKKLTIGLVFKSPVRAKIKWHGWGGVGIGAGCGAQRVVIVVLNGIRI